MMELEKTNLANYGKKLQPWIGKIVVDLGDVKGRVFLLTPDQEMPEYEKGHPVNEFLYVVSGEVIVTTPLGNDNVCEGETATIPPGIDHKLSVVKPAICMIMRDMVKAPSPKPYPK